MGVLLPSTRAFGCVPLAGEVCQPRRKERAPVAQKEDTNKQFVDHQPRCEIAKTLIAEGECQRLGEVQLDGNLLCEVFKMDEWLESVDGQADELRVWRAEHHRNELVEQLRFNRTRTEIIRDELFKD